MTRTMNKQVTYFEAMFNGKKEMHYTDGTAGFNNWMEVYEALYKAFGKKAEVTYIAYNDGTTTGVA